jgi:uncharacterized protein (TIGR03435 family)
MASRLAIGISCRQSLDWGLVLASTKMTFQRPRANRFVLLVALLASANSLRPQDQASVRFAVATIRPSRPEEQMEIVVEGRRFSTTQTSLNFLIAFAYKLHARQIVGQPSSLETERYDVVAQADVEGRLNPNDARIMVQRLLVDRSALRFHRDRKELSVYAIVSGNGGPRLTGSAGDPKGPPGVGFQGLGAMIVKNATMADFANFLQRYVLDRPMVDQSGIAGRFDFKLDWMPDETQFIGRTDLEAPSRAAEPPDLYTAIQQQIGLKLTHRKALTEVLVIDHVEKPSDN